MLDCFSTLRVLYQFRNLVITSLALLFCVLWQLLRLRVLITNYASVAKKRFPSINIEKLKILQKRMRRICLRVLFFFFFNIIYTLAVRSEIIVAWDCHLWGCCVVGLFEERKEWTWDLRERPKLREGGTQSRQIIRWTH